MLTPVLVKSATAIAGDGVAMHAAVWPVTEARDWLAEQIDAAARHLARLIAAGDAAGDDIDRLVAEVRGQLPALEEWAQQTAERVAANLVHAVEYAAAQNTAGPGGLVSAVWRTHPGDGAGHTHLDADGQVRAGGVPFTVDGTELRWPGDLNSPDGHAPGCRCRLLWVVSPAR
ncbi:hypothetical protein [Planomonospora algeriensis]